MKITKNVLRQLISEMLAGDLPPGSAAEKELRNITKQQFDTSDKDTASIVNARNKMSSALKNNQMDDDDLVSLAKAQGIDNTDPAIQNAANSQFVKQKAVRGDNPTADPDSRFAYFLKTVTTKKI